MMMSNGVWAWAMSPTKYGREKVRNYNVYLATNFGGQHKLLKKAEHPPDAILPISHMYPKINHGT